MKRRVVAIFLSLTLCMGGTLEAGAAALGIRVTVLINEKDGVRAMNAVHDAFNLAD